MVLHVSRFYHSQCEIRIDFADTKPVFLPICFVSHWPFGLDFLGFPGGCPSISPCAYTHCVGLSPQRAVTEHLLSLCSRKPCRKLSLALGLSSFSSFLEVLFLNHALALCITSEKQAKKLLQRSCEIAAPGAWWTVGGCFTGHQGTSFLPWAWQLDPTSI